MKWYKRDPDAAIAGMIGLSLEERGVYNTVIDLLYSRDGELPDDDQFFARACECRPQTWRRLRDSLLAKGKLHRKSDGKLTANRVVNELQTARKLMAKREQTDLKPEIVKPVSDEKANNNNDAQSNVAADNMAVHAREQPQPHPHPEKKDSRALAIATRPRLDDDFERFKKVYPKRDGANPWEPARKKFVAAVKSGVDPEAIIAGAQAYANAEPEKIRTPYIAQAKTWLNERRWKDYGAPMVIAAATGPPQPPLPGMRTHEEILADAERRKNEIACPEGARILALSLDIPGEKQHGMGADRKGERGIRRVGEIFPFKGMEAVCDQADGEGNDQGDDDASPMARMV